MNARRTSNVIDLWLVVFAAEQLRHRRAAGDKQDVTSPRSARRVHFACSAGGVMGWPEAVCNIAFIGAAAFVMWAFFKYVMN